MALPTSLPGRSEEAVAFAPWLASARLVPKLSATLTLSWPGPLRARNTGAESNVRAWLPVRAETVEAPNSSVRVTDNPSAEPDKTAGNRRPSVQTASNSPLCGSPAFGPKRMPYVDGDPRSTWPRNGRPATWLVAVMSARAAGLTKLPTSMAEKVTPSLPQDPSGMK